MKGIGAWLAAQRFDLLALAGAGSLGGGVWAQWGQPWAWMLWGVLALAVFVNHGLSLRRGA
jgi:hypothetical protein